MKLLSYVLVATLTFSAVQAQDVRPKAERNLVDLVNPLVGTASSYSLSHGNTYPAIAVPWGMNFWTPQTGKMGDGWGYTYQSDSIRGIKETHQPSPWINDYGAFSLMAVTGELKTDQYKRASKFSHSKEISKPNYYQVFLDDYGVNVEVTPTDRAAMFQFTFPASDQSWIILDAFHKGSSVTVLPEQRRIIGYSKNNSGGVPANFANYFILEFDQPFEEFGTVLNGQNQLNLSTATGKHTGAFIRFKTKAGQMIHVKVASSFISPEQAELNLNREIADRTFNQIRQSAADLWNEQMNRIWIDGGTQAQQITFYTALYHTLLFPRKFHEPDATGKIMHYSPYNGKVLPGYLYTDNGFWDTFRAVFPFFTLVYPDHNERVMEGLVNTYKESGWLPEWASPGHRNCMVGSNSASLIADSYIKGIRGYDINTLYEAILKNTENEGPMHSVGRFGVSYYNKLGYVPYDVNVNENAARTLEYSYDDFTIWKLAQALNRPQEEIDRFKQRAGNYRNLFDKSTNFMRGKNQDGSWQTPFVPEAWGGAFTEGSSWHYTWCVFQDPQGLIDLMGGDKAFVAKLDSVFTMPPIFDCSYYGSEIHEITEMVNGKMGQYAHGNQPIQHAIYLYDYAGTPWKAQYHLREVMNRFYSPEPDGLCGDEDNGQTSAWYVFSAMGMYSVCPGQPEYALGSPLFDKVTLNLDNGKQFIIQANHNLPENVYIDKATLNGKDYSRNYLKHEDIRQGGKLVFDMSQKPNLKRGTGVSDRPYSMSR
ncbi:MAG: GH92 family glycosyl hydrolase [Bacteroidales bacterium]|nr:GH92 family glycosyl hydrolase [Bacteroidales bacterium]